MARGDRTSAWAVAAAVASPVLLIVGWTVAAGRQPGGFDSISATISALADYPATDRWIMSGAIAACGFCNVVAARGLCAPRTSARRSLELAGLTGIAIALVPLGLNAVAHAMLAAICFGALALWPVLAQRQGLGFGVGAARSATALFLLLMLLVLLGQPAGAVGLVERVLAGGECLWLAAVAIGTRFVPVRQSAGMGA